MAEVHAFLKPGENATYTVSANVTAGQLVEITGVMTVGPAGAGSKKVVGVATYDKATTEPSTLVEVASSGIWYLTASGTVTAGDTVMSGAAGTVATIAAATGTYAAADTENAKAEIGVALETATTGNPVRVKFTKLA